MRVVITGAAGFIGSRLSEVLVAQAERLGYDDVVLFDALTYSGRLENLEVVLRDSRVTFIKGSITDELVTDEVLSGANAVLELAAASHVDRSITGARLFYETNVMGTQQLLDSARRTLRTRLHRRGLRVDRRRCLARGPPPRTELAVLVEQGRLGLGGAGVPAHVRTERHGDALLEQLRSAPVSRKTHSSLCHESF